MINSVYTKLVLLFVVLFSAISCGENAIDSLAPKSSKKELLEFKFPNEKNYHFHRLGDSLEFVFPDKNSLVNLEPKIEVSKLATFSPVNQKDFSKEVEYTVAAEDQSVTNYKIKAYKLSELFSLKFSKSNNSHLSKDYVLSGDTLLLEDNINLTDLKATVATHPDFTLVSPLQFDFTKRVDVKLESKLGYNLTISFLVLSNQVAPQVDQAKILSFKFQAANNSGVENDIIGKILYEKDNQGALVGKIGATVPHTADLANLVPSIELSAGSDYTPKNVRNFTQEVEYTVQNSNDHSTIKYLVNITKSPAPTQLAKITSFKIEASKNAGIDNDISATILYEKDDQGALVGKITATIPHTANIASLVPSIELSAGSDYSPKDVKDFSNQVEYTVQNSNDHSTIKYVVNITKLAAPEKASAKILSFKFLASKNAGIEKDIEAVITYEKQENTNHVFGRIKATVPHTANMFNLQVDAEYSQHTKIVGSLPNHYLNQVTIQLTNDNGTPEDDDDSSIYYLVNITKAAAPPVLEKKILSFVFETKNNHGLAKDMICAVSQEEKTIRDTVPHDFDFSVLKNPTVVHQGGELVKPNNPNFEWPGFSYFVKDQYNRTVSYKVYIYKSPAPPVLSSEKKLVSFKFTQSQNSGLDRDYIGTLNEQTHRVEFHLSDKLEITNLIPTLSVSNKATTAPVVAKDFTNEVVYTVTAEDGTTQDYRVKINQYKDFKSKWRTTVPNEILTLPLYNTSGQFGYYDCWVDWGDGTPATHITSTNYASNRRHTFATPGEHIITISGKLVGFNFSIVSTSKDKILDIVQWGDMHIGTHLQHFKGATNLVISASDSPNLKYVGNMKYSFAYIPNLKIDNFNNWDFSGCGSMERMFEGSTNFNQAIYNKTTVNVRDMSFMFFRTNFNSSVVFETRAVTTMESMFEQAKQFNQRLTFYTASVKNMKNMFREATSYNQQIDFNISSLENAQAMFNYATNFNSPVNFVGACHRLNNVSFMFAHATKFNQPVSFGDNPQYTTGLRNMGAMFTNASNFNSAVTANTENVTSMYSMFSGSAFNQPINFDTRNVTTMYSMFNNTPFNQELPDSFVTSNVTSMENMFSDNTSFNQEVDFDVAKVTNFNGMFFNATNFQSALIYRNLGQVNCSMKTMFYNANKFNADLSAWNVSKVTNVVAMFQDASSFNNGGVVDANGKCLTTWRFNLISAKGILGVSDDFDDRTAGDLAPNWGNN